MKISTLINNALVPIQLSNFSSPLSALPAPSFTRSLSQPSSTTDSLALPSSASLPAPPSAASSSDFSFTCEPLIQLSPSTSHRFDAPSVKASASGSVSVSVDSCCVAPSPSQSGGSPSPSIAPSAALTFALTDSQSRADKKKARKEANRQRRSVAENERLASIADQLQKLGELSSCVDRATHTKQQQAAAAASEARALLKANTDSECKSDVAAESEAAAKPSPSPSQSTATPMPAIAEESATSAELTPWTIIYGEAGVVPDAPWLDVPLAFSTWHSKPTEASADVLLSWDPYSYAPKPGELFWAKGVGYGSGSSGWDVDQYLQQLEDTDRAITAIFRSLATTLKAHSDAATFVQRVAELMFASPLMFTMEAYLRNDSVTDMVQQHYELYHALFELCDVLLTQSFTWCRMIMFTPISSASSTHAASLLLRASEQVTAMHKFDAKAEAAAAALAAIAAEAEKKHPSSQKKKAAKVASLPSDDSDSTESRSAELCSMIQSLAANIKSIEKGIIIEQQSLVACESTCTAAAAAAASAAAQLRYESFMRSCTFDEVARFGPDDHHYQYELERCSRASGATTSQRKLVKRLASEFADLANGALPTHVDSTILMRVHDTQLQMAQFVVFAPPDTPYGHGAFLFDAFFPLEYPSTPPLVNLQTTGRNTFRFNPNLYECGKVCLSILGTWSGGKGEGWNTSTSTFLQVAVSVQALIFVPEPYFNEPSYEFTMHTAHGRRESAKYNAPVQVATIKFAMIEMMRNPPRGFEPAIATHFAHHRESIMRQAREWAKSNPEITDKLLEELQTELDRQQSPEAAL